MPKPAALLRPFIRAYFRAGSAVAPTLIDRKVVRLFGTPARARPQSPQRDAWWIPSGDYRIAVYSEGWGPTVLLAHGWSGTADDMRSIADEMRGRGFRVVTFDMPAHGRSSGRWTTLPAMARATVDVANAVGPVSAIIGHSLGGAAALLAMRDGLDARCAALIAPPREPRHFLAALVDALGLSRERMNGVVREVERVVGPMSQFESDRVARSLDVPGLIVHDIADRQVPFAHGAAIADAWSGAELFAVERVGHRRVLDADFVIERVAAFVERNVRSIGSPGLQQQAFAKSRMRRPTQRTGPNGTS